MIKYNMLRGDEDVYVPAHLNFGKTMLDHLRSMGDEVAIENADTGENMTYKQITQYAVDLSVALTKLGVRRGDVVALGTEKRILIIPTMIGVLMSGATYTPYDLAIGRAVLHHNINVAKPKFFIYSEKFWNKYSEVLKKFDFERLLSWNDVLALTQEHSDVTKFEPVDVQGQIDVAFILYSSGTTGWPKGVQLTHLNCFLKFRTINKNELLQNNLTTGEWYHGHDISISFGVLLFKKHLIYTNNREVNTIMKGIERSQANVAYLSPYLLNQMLTAKDGEKEYNIESLKCLYSTGSPLSKETSVRLKQRFPTLKHVMQLYGCTEAGAVSVATEDPMFHLKPQSIGNVRPGFTVKVVKTETEERLGPNQKGEIRFKSPGVMKGYIGVDSSTYLDKEGFYKSGDYGYYDDDGCLFIVSRLKEIIKYNGFAVSPVQIEDILLQHPAVLEAGVVGKPAPYVEELPTAFIVKQPAINVTEQELIDYIAEEVDTNMQLRGGVIFVKELPKTPTGKIRRLRLKEMLNEHTF